MATELELSASQKLICEQGPLYPRRFLCIKVFSSLSKERLNESFSQIVNRHENLRLRISNDDFSKYPRCEIQDEAYLDIQFFDWTDMSLEKLQKRIDGLKTFDVKASGLVQQTPLSLTVIETAFKWFYLYLNTSALTTDLLSCLNIVNEFEHFYIQNTNPTADIYQFSQYAIWHNNILYEQDEEAKAFWSQRRLYSSHEEALTLEKKCQNVSEMRLPSILTLDLGGEVLSKIKEYIELNDISLKLFLVSCWSILLKKYSKNNVVTVGLINEERSYDVFDSIIGPVALIAPLRIDFDNVLSVEQLHDSIQEEWGQWEDWRDYYNPMEEQSISTKGYCSYAFEYLDVSFSSDKLSLQSIGGISENSKLKLLCVNNADRISADFYYDNLFFDRCDIELLRKNLLSLVDNIVSHNKDGLESIMSSRENQLDLLSNHRDRVISDDKEDLITLFQRRVNDFPSKNAVIFNGQTTSYKALDDRSNQLANLLKNRYQISSGEIVALKCQRSIDMVIAVLGVIKSGAVLMPIDLRTPEKRTRYLLEDSNAKILISHQKYDHLNVDQVDLTDPQDSYEHESTDFETIINTGNIYLIYTSGSTGLPKGVLVSQRALLNYLNWFTEKGQISPSDNTLIISSIAFDLTYTTFYSSLITGASMHLFEDEDYFDGERFIDDLVRHQVTYLKLTPTHFRILVNSPNFRRNAADLKLKLVVIGGEEINLTDIRKYLSINSDCKFLNHYGPTECTIGICTSDINENNIDEYEGRPAVGRPISSNSAYIMDERGQICDDGVIGEICIEGLNLAEGYLNNPELTAEKFLKVSGDNFRLYKTGDLGYLLNDQIVFCGRSDTQVKFNGHRINLIEIEYSLESYELINEAVVQYYQTPEKKIVAYVTGDQAMSPSVIQEFLSSSLPHYMIPSEFNYLERMPAKANGKKDRTNLTNSNYVKLVEESYASPRSEFEMALVNVWSEILAKELVGVKDNFFRLGGDSIKAIQVVSRLHQMGFKLTIKDLLKNPVLENMAEHIGSFQNRISQDMVHGQFPLSPVQLYFFEHHKHHLNQYNQSFLIELKEERPDRSSLEDIISKIFQHHDMLRINFKMTEDGICQTCTDFMEPYHLEECDLENDPNPEESFRKKVNQIQSSFDVFKGPLVKFTLFLFPDSTKLLTVMHHLITDGVSWRIIFDDLESLLRQHKNGETYHLPLKTSSYKSWIERLMEWSKSKEMISDLSYWSNMPSVVDDKIRRDKTNEEDNLIKDERDLTFSLSAADTDLIVSKVNDTFKTTVNDVLLAALSKAFTTVFNLDNIVIGVEGHGREDMFDDIDITRTVGWFTSIYPVSMEHAHDLSLTDHIIAVKEIMHNVPNNGIGYGVFKYLRPNETDSPDQKPSVLFNYLGKIDNELESTDFNLAQDDIGQERDERMDRIYEFRINAIMVKNVLNVSIGYNRNHYHLFTIERLKETILDTLSEIIELSSSTTEEIVSPSDFTFKGLSKSDLQNLID